MLDIRTRGGCKVTSQKDKEEVKALGEKAHFQSSKQNRSTTFSFYFLPTGTRI